MKLFLDRSLGGGGIFMELCRQILEFKNACEIDQKAKLIDSLKIGTEEMSFIELIGQHFSSMPKELDLLNHIGTLLSAGGVYERAQEIYEDALKLSGTASQKAIILYNQYINFLQMNEWDEAFASYNKACEKDSGLELFNSKKYIPIRIFSADHLGVTFLCKSMLGEVLVTALNTNFSDRFLAEAASLKKLTSLYTLALEDFGYLDWDNQKSPFVVWEYFAGTDLQKWIEKNGAFSFDEGMKISKMIVIGLMDACEKGIIHRDLRPANILYKEEKGEISLKIKQFALALDENILLQWKEELQNISQKDNIVAKSLRDCLDYASPERKLQQVAGKTWSLAPYTDIYSFSKTLRMFFFGSLNPRVSQLMTFPSPELISFFDRCEEEIPSKRPQTFSSVQKKLSQITSTSTSIKSNVQNLSNKSNVAKENVEGKKKALMSVLSPTLKKVLFEQKKVDRYDLIEELGHGAMGIVYKGMDSVLRRTVAIKFLVGESNSDRILREARTTANLKHNNIVGLYDIGTLLDNNYYLVMEYIDGASLEEKIQNAPLPYQEVVDYIEKIASALAAAHEIGVVHRDIKPSNILLTKQNEPKIADFGLAKEISMDSAMLTGDQQILGTPIYMSPEQITGDKIDGRSDIYSLGITMFQMLNGRLPFPEGNVYSILIARLEEGTMNLIEYNPDVPDQLVCINELMMTKDKEKRVTAKKVISALKEFREIVSSEKEEISELFNSELVETQSDLFESRQSNLFESREEEAPFESSRRKSTTKRVGIHDIDWLEGKEEKKEPVEAMAHESQPICLDELDKEVKKESNASDVPTNMVETKTTQDDLKLGRLAVRKNLITIADLQACMEEKQKLSRQGHSVTLRHILIEKKLVTEEDLDKITGEITVQSKSSLEESMNSQELLLGKYRILEKIGSGGMGAVYKIEHVMLEHNKYFALKVMHPSIADNQNSYKRFVREVEVAMGLMHKNIIAIREFGILPDFGPYLTMDFSTGQGLDFILKENWDKDAKLSLYITRQILEALQVAHKKKVIHRDLKPANVLIEEEEGEKLVKLVDFGLAKLVEESENVESITHGVVGTPLYMSPEQASGEKVDNRSDLYSVGIILYQMLTGAPPFQAKSLREMLKKQLFEQPPAPHTINPNIPINLENVILKAIAKEPEDRYQTAKEFISAIDSIKDKIDSGVSNIKNRRDRWKWLSPAAVEENREAQFPSQEEEEEDLVILEDSLVILEDSQEAPQSLIKEVLEEPIEEYPVEERQEAQENLESYDVESIEEEIPEVVKTPEELYEEEIEEGKRAEYNNEFQKAKLHYRKAKQINPDDPEASSLLKEIDEKAKEHNFQRHLEKAHQAEEAGDLKEAAFLYRKALGLKPKDPEIEEALQKIKITQLLQGIHQRFQEQDWGKALTLCREMGKEFPNHPELKALTEQSKQNLERNYRFQKILVRSVVGILILGIIITVSVYFIEKSSQERIAKAKALLEKYQKISREIEDQKKMKDWKKAILLYEDLKRYASNDAQKEKIQQNIEFISCLQEADIVEHDKNWKKLEEIYRKAHSVAVEKEDKKRAEKANLFAKYCLQGEKMESVAKETDNLEDWRKAAEKFSQAEEYAYNPFTTRFADFSERRCQSRHLKLLTKSQIEKAKKENDWNKVASLYDMLYKHAIHEGERRRLEKLKKESIQKGLFVNFVTAADKARKEQCWEFAEKHYRKAMNLNLPEDKKVVQSLHFVMKMSKGARAVENKSWKEATLLYQNAVKIAKDDEKEYVNKKMTKYKYLYCYSTYLRNASWYQKRRKWKKAKFYYRKALRYADKENKDFVRKTLRHLKLYRQLQKKISEKNWKEAREIFKKIRKVIGDSKILEIYSKKMPYTRLPAKYFQLPEKIAVGIPAKFIFLRHHTIQSSQWNFGDGYTSTKAETSHIYKRRSKIQLSITLHDGISTWTQSLKSYVILGNTPPEIKSWTAPNLAQAGHQIHFDVRAIDKEGEEITYLWDFGDGTQKKGVVTTHSYKGFGSYRVMLKVRDGANEVRRTKYIQVLKGVAADPIARKYPNLMMQFETAKTLGNPEMAMRTWLQLRYDFRRKSYRVYERNEKEWLRNKSEECNIQYLKAQASHPKESYRYSAARNRRTPKEILLRLSLDSSYRVRNAAKRTLSLLKRRSSRRRRRR